MNPVGIARKLRDRLLGRTRQAPVILMYHRVAALHRDPWGLAVPPDRFDEQMAELARARTPLSLDDFASALRAGELPRDAVAVTFDDGYLDNLTQALPILERHRIPATLFLTTGDLGEPGPFWWDRLERLVLDHDRALDTVFELGGEQIPLRWNDAPDPADWRASQPATTGRQRAFIASWTALRELQPSAREAILQRLEARLQRRLGAGDNAEDRLMNADELQRLLAGGVFTLGAHSVTHPALVRLPVDARRHEIMQSRCDCEAVAGRPVVGFAYPFGDVDGAVRAEVVAGGYAYACTTRHGFVTPDTDPFLLPRIAVGASGSALSS